MGPTLGQRDGIRRNVPAWSEARTAGSDQRHFIPFHRAGMFSSLLLLRRRQVLFACAAGTNLSSFIPVASRFYSSARNRASERIASRIRGNSGGDANLSAVRRARRARTVKAPPVVELPIDAHRESIIERINSQPVTVLQGETGCGKST
jgi:HrpA-like RNA helicase